MLNLTVIAGDVTVSLYNPQYFVNRNSATIVLLRDRVTGESVELRVGQELAEELASKLCFWEPDEEGSYSFELDAWLDNRKNNLRPLP
jgi:hypothetical protein